MLLLPSDGAGVVANDGVTTNITISWLLVCKCHVFTFECARGTYCEHINVNKFHLCMLWSTFRPIFVLCRHTLYNTKMYSCQDISTLNSCIRVGGKSK